MTQNFGMLLLGVGLIVWGILLLTGTALPSVVGAVWAIVTGLLILAGR